MDVTIIGRTWDISIHALLAESDLISTKKGQVLSLFLSTLSLRRATRYVKRLPCSAVHFYPRSPCGERRYTQMRGGRTFRHFYPRSPCGERLADLGTIPDVAYFYPRSPCGERLLTAGPLCPPKRISIHALLAESDLLLQGSAKQISHFYPRSPCGERLTAHKWQGGTTDFYPRSPCGERLPGPL